MRSSVLQTAFAFLLLGGVACSDPSQPDDYDPPARIVRVAAVRVTPQVIQFSAVGDTRQLAATVFPTNAADKAIIWESTDSTVASVDANGLVTARGSGSGAFITAYTHDGRHEASVNVTVAP